MEQLVWQVEKSPLLNLLRKRRKNEYPSGFLEKENFFLFGAQFKTLSGFCDSVTCFFRSNTIFFFHLGIFIGG